LKALRGTAEEKALLQRYKLSLELTKLIGDLQLEATL
jgi:hypothetical protein